MVSNMLEIVFCHPVSALLATVLGFKVGRGAGTDSLKDSDSYHSGTGRS